jgi:putative hydrolase of the HAD superfamily
MEVMQEYLLKQKIDVSIDQLSEAYRRNQQSFAKIWMEEHRTPTNEERIRAMSADLSFEIPSSVIGKIDKAFAEIILRIPPRLIDRSVETIQTLSLRYKLAIISDTGFSSGKYLRQLLKKFGILNSFQSFAFSDEIGRSKPHQDVFNTVLSSLKIKPREMVHIGDLERTDIVGAQALGIFTIHLVRHLADPPVSRADFVIHSYPEIFNCLNQISGRA